MLNVALYVTLSSSYPVGMTTTWRNIADQLTPWQLRRAGRRRAQRVPARPGGSDPRANRYQIEHALRQVVARDCGPIILR
jgi:hypothetical protein